MVRTAIYLRRPAGHFGSDVEHCPDLRQAVEDRGGTVAATYVDDDHATVRTRNAQWKALLADLCSIDQLAIESAADLPGRTVRDLLKVLGMFRDHGVGLYIHRDGIDTNKGGPFTVLDIGQAYRRDKLSRSIRAGQARALAAGKVVGRPAIRPCVRRQIRAHLADGAGVRHTARKFRICAASVINIRRQAMTGLDRQAA
jgi:DNA invertase Pin-like site-specific DNA recombinase